SKPVPGCPVEKMAQNGCWSKSTVNPTCWKCSDWNVAANSSDWPGVKSAVGLANAPSVVSAPPATVAVALGSHLCTCQSAGSALSLNSAPKVGLSCTSPEAGPVSCATTEQPLPPPKSAAVVSVAAKAGVVNDAGGSLPNGDVALLFNASADVAR